MTETEIKSCCHCGHIGEPIIEVQTTGKHYAKARCAGCGKYLCWIAKPDSDATKYRRESAHRKMAKKFSRGFCELCLIREDDLPRSESLEAHHVVEYQDGGEATRENTWVLCTACHKLVNWRRTYVGHWLGN